MRRNPQRRFESVLALLALIDQFRVFRRPLRGNARGSNPIAFITSPNGGPGIGPSANQQFGPAVVPFSTTTTWSSLLDAPFYIVDPAGNGNFTTIGAAMSTVTTGTVYVLANSYTENAFAFGGSNLMLYFEPGCSLAFVASPTYITPPIFGGGTHYPAGNKRLIHMGCSVTSSTGIVYNHQYLIGNGLQLNYGSQGASGNNGIILHIPGQSSSTAYSGAGGFDYKIMGIDMTGSQGASFLQLQVENFGILSLTYAQLSFGFEFKDIHITPGASTFANCSVVYLRGGWGGVCDNLKVDCGAINTGNDYDPINVSGLLGEMAQWTFRHYETLGNGASGQCFELQGTNGSGNVTAGLHDLSFVQCLFNSGAANPVAAGAGGGFIDDNDGSGVGQIYDIEFYQCRWVNVIMTYVNVTQVISPTASPFTFTNATSQNGTAGVSGIPGTMPIVMNLVGGTVSSVTITPKGGSATATNATAGLFMLRPGDAAIVTYTVAPTLTWQAFGYIRYMGPMPSSFQSSLVGRSPGAGGAFYAIATGVNYTNLDGFIETVIISGGTVTGINYNGNATGRSTGDFQIWPTDTLNVAFTGATQLIVQVK